jgi:hypothetical protein
VARDFKTFYFTYIPAVPGVVLWMSLGRMSFSQLGKHGAPLESVREQLVSQRLRKYLVWKNKFVLVLRGGHLQLPKYGKNRILFYNNGKKVIRYDSIPMPSSESYEQSMICSQNRS